jgi:hypothetical protein
MFVVLFTLDMMLVRKKEAYLFIIIGLQTYWPIGKEDVKERGC